MQSLFVNPNLFNLLAVLKTSEAYWKWSLVCPPDMGTKENYLAGQILSLWHGLAMPSPQHHCKWNTLALSQTLFEEVLESTWEIISVRHFKVNPALFVLNAVLLVAGMWGGGWDTTPKVPVWDTANDQKWGYFQLFKTQPASLVCQ